jgi:hypothetical protein
MMKFGRSDVHGGLESVLVSAKARSVPSEAALEEQRRAVDNSLELVDTVTASVQTT